MSIKKGVGMRWSSVLLIFLTLFAEASQIEKVKGKKVLIGIDQETFEVGDKIFALDDNGKRKAALKIIKVQGSKAQATVEKGRVTPGMAVTLGGGGRGSQSGAAGARKSSGKRMGIIGGLSQNTMTISAGGSSSSFSGMSFAVAGMVDLPLSQKITLRGKAGANQFSVAKDGVGAAFTYLGFEGGLNLNLTKSFWVGGGGAFLLTASKSSNIPGLDASASTNSFFFAGLGANISIGRNRYIPISFDYALYPGGAGVAANSLLIRAGYAWDF